MNNLAQAMWAEQLKARRSKVPLITALGFAMIPLAGGFFMVVLRDPEMARRVGLITVKAQLTMGAADWPTYFNFLTLAVGAAGSFLFGLIATWVFGREYSDRTVKDLLALPTARSSIVSAKFVVIVVWSAAVTLIACLLTLLVGSLLQLPPEPPALFWQTAATLAAAACMGLALVTPVAWVASAWHGYLPAVGVMILVLALAQFSTAAGWGEYFPWAVPGLFVQGEALGAGSYIIVALTGLVGLAGTLLWWEWADQTR